MLAFINSAKILLQVQIAKFLNIKQSTFMNIKNYPIQQKLLLRPIGLDSGISS
jgi:hypothetical protein